MLTTAAKTAYRFPDRLRLPLVFDAARLAQDFGALMDVDWTRHFVPDNFEGDWSALPLRSQVGATHPIKMIYADPMIHDYVDTPLLARTPYFREVLATFECPLELVRLMRLTPGSVIKEHRDHDLQVETGSARLHIPILTNPDVDFRLADVRVDMAPGSAWYLRLSEPHRVTNNGTADRVHLVIDVLANDWLEALFESAVA